MAKKKAKVKLTDKEKGDKLCKAMQKILDVLPPEDDMDYDPGQIVMDVEEIANKAIYEYELP